MALLEQLAEFLDHGEPRAHGPAGERDDPHLLLPTVLLFLDLVQSEAPDAGRDARSLRRSLRRGLGLRRREAAAILEMAARARTQGAGDLAAHAERIRRDYDTGKRRHIVASLWRIVDSATESRESRESREEFVARAARLLGLTPGEGVRARMLGNIARA